MKKYTRPTSNVIAFSVEDVITQSGIIVNSNELTGASAEMYNVYQKNSTAKNTNISVFTW